MSQDFLKLPIFISTSIQNYLLQKSKIGIITWECAFSNLCQKIILFYIKMLFIYKITKNKFLSLFFIHKIRSGWNLLCLFLKVSGCQLISPLAHHVTKRDKWVTKQLYISFYFYRKSKPEPSKFNYKKVK